MEKQMEFWDGWLAIDSVDSISFPDISTHIQETNKIERKKKSLSRFPTFSFPR